MLGSSAMSPGDLDYIPGSRRASGAVEGMQGEGVEHALSSEVLLDS